MKLIDMLVEDGMNGWQWPNGYADVIVKRYDAVADDWATAIITREQYEAALAAKNEGWIYWGGGECPVDTKTLVDIRLKVGFTYKSCHPGDYSWRHAGGGGDIIAYRLHKSQEVTEADDEADLNECIGQEPKTEWNGEGLPPVGVECEYTKESLPGNEWTQCTVDYVGASFVVYRDCYGVELTGIIGDIKFRPIRSEADEKRDDRASAIDGFISGFRGQKTGSNKELAYAITDYLALLDKL